MTNRPVLAVGVILFNDKQEVLLVQRAKPPSENLYSVPGGKVEPGETLEAACKRELFEETGLAASVGPLVEVVEYIDDTFHYVILDYLAHSPTGTLQAGADAKDARFAPLCLLEQGTLPLTAGLLQLLRRAASLFRG